MPTLKQAARSLLMMQQSTGQAVARADTSLDAGPAAGAAAGLPAFKLLMVNFCWRRFGVVRSQEAALTGEAPCC
jgi:hypothetical protein